MEILVSVSIDIHTTGHINIKIVESSKLGEHNFKVILLHLELHKTTK